MIITQEKQKMQYLTEVSGKDKVWNGHKLMAERVSLIYANHPFRRDFHRYGQRISHCSTVLGFSKVIKDRDVVNLNNFSHDEQYKLKRANFCRVRFCPICQWRRSLAWMARFYGILPKINEKYLGYRWISLVLTVKNCDVQDVGETLTHMNKSFARFIRKPDICHVGGIKSFECTRSEDGKAHPHFHVLLLVHPRYFKDKYLKHSDFVQLWRDSLKVDYDPVVSVQAVKYKGKRKFAAEELERENKDCRHFEDAILETIKYSVKPSDMVEDEEWFYELNNQLHKRRAISVFGSLRELLSDNEEFSEAEMLQGDSFNLDADTENQIIYFGWREYNTPKYGRIWNPFNAELRITYNTS